MPNKNATKENKKINIINTDYGFDIHLNGKLTNIHHYIELCNILSNQSYSEFNYWTINIYINSPGGTSTTGIQIANFIKQSKHKINCIVAGECSSAATFIALAGKNLILFPGTYMYFHNFSQSVTSVPGAELKRFIDNENERITAAFEYFYYPFLNMEEIQSLGHDKDLYIHAGCYNLADRIKRHFPEIKCQG